MRSSDADFEVRKQIDQLDRPLGHSIALRLANHKTPRCKDQALVISGLVKLHQSLIDKGLDGGLMDALADQV